MNERFYLYSRKKRIISYKRACVYVRYCKEIVQLTLDNEKKLLTCLHVYLYTFV